MLRRLPLGDHWHQVEPTALASDAWHVGGPPGRSGAEARPGPVPPIRPPPVSCRSPPVPRSVTTRGAGQAWGLAPTDSRSFSAGRYNRPGSAQCLMTDSTAFGESSAQCQKPAKQTPPQKKTAYSPSTRLGSLLRPRLSQRKPREPILSMILPGLTSGKSAASHASHRLKKSSMPSSTQRPATQFGLPSAVGRCLWHSLWRTCSPTSAPIA